MTRSMFDQPAGWYRDPAPAVPSDPQTLRWWDGRDWTTQVRTAPRKLRQQWLSEDAAAARAHVADLLERTEAGDPVARHELTAVLHPPAVTTGAPFAGRGRRFAALWLDGLITGTAVVLLVHHQLLSGFQDILRQAAQTNASSGSVDTLSVLRNHDLLVATLVGAVVVLLYEVGFTKAFAATPGKLVLGLEIRMVDRPGPLSWSAVLLRWALKRGVVSLPATGVAYAALLLLQLADLVWVFPDPRRQALHDKLARTVVVRRA